MVILIWESMISCSSSKTATSWCHATSYLDPTAKWEAPTVPDSLLPFPTIPVSPLVDHYDVAMFNKERNVSKERKYNRVPTIRNILFRLFSNLSWTNYSSKIFWTSAMGFIRKDK